MSDRPIVRTAQGPVVGLRRESHAMFLGIPYAADTGGTARFRPPRPREPWSTPRPAIVAAAPSAQTEELGTPSANEDCLNLNVYAPWPPGADRPVMVWLHGGGYTNGTGNQYDGGVLVEEAGVVLVTVNYRLGASGFLTLPGLTAESPQRTSGNYALLDQQAALRWTQRNISQFGGDPTNVTVFGESAGATSLLAQLVSPGAAGLFHRGISQSGGSARLTRTLLEAEEAWIAAIDRANRPPPEGVDLGCPTDASPDALVASLRAAPVQKLMAVGQDVAFSGPIVDGHVIPMSGREAFEAGRFHRVPLIMGSNRDENTFFAHAQIPTQHAYEAALADKFGPALAPEVAGRYPADAHGGSFTQAFAAVLTDASSVCRDRSNHDRLARYVPVYAYEFQEREPVLWQPSWVPNPPDGSGLASPPPDVDFGATHTAELAYVFGVDATGVRLEGRASRLSSEVIAYWTSFAETGSPNGTADEPSVRPHWDVYRVDDPHLLVLADPVRREDGRVIDSDHHREFWQSAGLDLLVGSDPWYHPDG